MQSQQTDLGTAPVGKLLTRLAVPAITAQMVNMLYNLVDRVYIGHLPDVGTQALTGVGVCFPHYHAGVRLCGAGVFRRCAPGQH